MSRPRPIRGLLLLLWGLGFAVSLARADEAADEYAVAAGHYSRQQWALAAEQFERFLHDHPDDPRAAQSVFFLAESLAQTGQSEAAGKQFAEYLRREPEGRWARSARFRAAEAAYLTGRHEEAREALEAFRKAHPEDKLDAYVLAYLGEIALARGDSLAAEEAYREAMRRFPTGALKDEYQLGLARALAAQKRTDEAVATLEAIVEKADGPLAEEARFRLGVLHYDAGRHEQAVHVLDRLAEAPAESPWRLRGALVRAAALRRIGRLDEARQLLESLSADAELGPKARYGLGLIEMDQKRWDAAAAVLLAVAAEHPKHEMIAAIRVHAGEALLRAGRDEEAAAQFDAALAEAPAEDPWRDDALRGRIQVAARRNDAEALDRQATEFLNEHSSSPFAPEVRRLLGRLLIEREEFSRAVDVLKPLAEGTEAGAVAPADAYLLAVAYQGCGRDADGLACLGPALASAAGGLRDDALLVQGALLTNLKRYSEAIEPLRHYLATQPNGRRAVAAKAQLAVSLARAGKVDEAKGLHRELLAEHATDEAFAPAVEQLAEAAYAAGDYPWAGELFGWLVDQAPDAQGKTRGLAGLAWCQVKDHRPADAVATFQRVLDADPEPRLAVEATWAAGRILEQLKQYDAAIGMYDRILEGHPKSSIYPEALLAAARLRDQLQQDAEAARLYERFASRWPKDPRIDAVLYQWSWSLQEAGEAQRSSDLLRRLCEEYPQSAYRGDAMYRLAQRATEAGQHDEADQWISRLLTGKPAASLGAHALCLRWQIAATAGQWDRVADAAAQLIADYPESPLRTMAEFWMAECAFRNGDYAEAGRRFDQLAKATQDESAPWLAIIPLRRAQILAHEEKWSEAHEMALAVVRRYPTFEQRYEVDYLLGRCLAARADFESAREMYLRVIQSPSSSKTETAAMAQWMIGESYFHQKDYESALRAYLRVEILYAYPRWQAGALLQAGKCCERLGQNEEAAKLYARVVDVYPNTPFVDEAKERRASLERPAAPSQSRRPTPPANVPR